MSANNGKTAVHGEWRLFHSDDGHAWIANDRLENVCWVRNEDYARLIAAAPSMYEALRQIAERHSDKSVDGQIARTALKLAMGDEG